jgi:hypothetical protein
MPRDSAGDRNTPGRILARMEITYPHAGHTAEFVPPISGNHISQFALHSEHGMQAGRGGP